MCVPSRHPHWRYEVTHDPPPACMSISSLRYCTYSCGRFRMGVPTTVRVRISASYWSNRSPSPASPWMVSLGGGSAKGGGGVQGRIIGPAPPENLGTTRCVCRSKLRPVLVVCSQSFFRFVYFGDDCFCGSGPDEGPGSLVTAFDVAGNGVNEFVDAAHSESLQSASGRSSRPRPAGPAGRSQATASTSSSGSTPRRPPLPWSASSTPSGPRPPPQRPRARRRPGRQPPSQPEG